LSLEEKNFLQNEFEKQHYPNTDMIKEFSDKLNLSFLQIKNWFALNRRKYRNKMKLAFKTSNFKNFEDYLL
jgi:hypothetical protein